MIIYSNRHFISKIMAMYIYLVHLSFLLNSRCILFESTESFHGYKTFGQNNIQDKNKGYEMLFFFS